MAHYIFTVSGCISISTDKPADRDPAGLMDVVDLTVDPSDGDLYYSEQADIRALYTAIENNWRRMVDPDAPPSVQLARAAALNTIFLRIDALPDLAWGE